MQTDMLTFDHLRLVKDDPGEVRRFRRFLRAMERGGDKEPVVAHEHDNRCCRRESWPETFTRLALAAGLAKPAILFDLPEERPEDVRRILE